MRATSRLLCCLSGQSPSSTVPAFTYNFEAQNMKLNLKASIKSAIINHIDITKNHADGIAFKMDAKSRLYTRVASCLVGEPKFYHEWNIDGTVDVNQDKLLIEEIKTVANTDPEFILQLANYTRNELYLRSISIILLVEASLIADCKPFVRKYTPRIVKRADELSESVAYLQRKIGHLGNKADKGSMPSCLKKGLADAFNNFNAYSLQKYNKGGFVKLKDVLRLVHPKPKDESQSLVFKQLNEDTLPTPNLWETIISGKGSTKEDWESALPEMGYMAMLRNLRNLMVKGVDMKPVLEVLTNAEKVRSSKHFPFRFYSAYRAVESTHSAYGSNVLDALENAMDISADNLPKLKGITFIAADNSRSMDSALSEKSTVSYKDAANMMLALAHRMCEFPITSIFAERFSVVSMSQRNGVISNMLKIREINVGEMATKAYLALKYLIDNKIKVDRMILFSDMQCYDNTFQCYDDTFYGASFSEQLKLYKSKINPNVYAYLVDLAGYGTMQVPKDESNVSLIAGWSDRILEFISLFEEDKKLAVERIKGL